MGLNFSFVRRLLLVVAALLPTTAHAEWREARSRHFIVYSEADEPTLRAYLAKLEKFDFMLRTVTGTKAPANPNKLTIFLLDSANAVERTLPYPSSGVVGYYDYSPRGAFFVGIRSNRGDADDLKGQTVLFHEYAHHFMYQYFPASYPSWYSEGFAEFYGTAEILDDDVIEVGRPAQHRYGSFYGGRWLPLDKMLTARNYGDIGTDVDLLYAQGWLLVHYLSFGKERAGQLARYLAEINSGKSYEEAMTSAFGPGAKTLNSELFAYAGRRRVSLLSLPFKKIDVGPIEIRGVSPAEDTLMLHQITLAQGVLQRDSQQFAREIRAIAARFPDDPAALSALVEAERAAGNHANAAAAADRLLALRPGDPRAAMHRFELAIEALRAARSTDKAAWNAARDQLVAAHRRAPDDPLILEAYYDSFIAEGLLPPAGAQAGLFRAHELLPQDEGLRFKVAADFERRDMIKDALHVIRPAALVLPDPAEESGRRKREREKWEERYRETGSVKQETARDMMLRLEQKLAASKEGDTAALAASQ